MSEPDDRLPPPFGSTPPPHQPSGCVTALIGLVGVILLLPGLCALFFVGGASRIDSSLMLVVLICFIVAVFGVLMIVAAIRRASRR